MRAKEAVTERNIAILGGGNLGMAIARGVVRSGRFPPGRVHVTRRDPDHLRELAYEGHPTGASNPEAVEQAEVVILCVLPQQLDPLLEEIATYLDPDRHVVVSTVSGASISAMRRNLGDRIPVVRAMPNLGVQIRESMTCIAADPVSEGALPLVEEVFGCVGETIRIGEDQVTPATALCACGIAFFLRAIRAAAQGGNEIGFHADEAIRMAAQTAKGAAEILLENRSHPEMEIDKVTTPNGCTIAGLNDMENRGFSSALIRGIVTSSERAAVLYRGTESS